MGPEVDGREDPTECDRLLFPCSTIADCSDPSAESILGAWVEEHRRVQEGPLGWVGPVRTAAGVGMHDLEEEDPVEGGLELVVGDTAVAVCNSQQWEVLGCSS